MPTKHQILYYFDKILGRPIAVRFEQENSDGWFRVKVLEPNTSSTAKGEYMADVPSSFFLSRANCIMFQVRKLLGQLPIGTDFGAPYCDAKALDISQFSKGDISRLTNT